MWSRFYSLPNDKVLDWSKFKAFAEDKIIQTKKLKIVFGRVENIVGEGENAGYSIFSFSHNVFKSFLFSRCSKSGLCGKGLTGYKQHEFNPLPDDKF